MARTPIPTIEEMMGLHGNDWSTEDIVFRKIWPEGLAAENCLDAHVVHNHTVGPWRIATSLSVVIPVHNAAERLYRCLNVLRAQSFFGFWPELAEIIIIDDGTYAARLPDPVDTYELAKAQIVGVPLRFYELTRNAGRAVARNCGVYFAEGDVVLFLDGDMLLEPSFITEHMIRHAYLTNLAILGLRTPIKMGDEADIDANDLIPRFSVDWRGDWRCRRDPVGHRTNFCGHTYRKGERVSIYEVTEGFRKWQGRIHGKPLPSVFQTSCASVRRHHVRAAGGFRNYYHGWGLEDCDMGSRLLARGVRLVPCPASASRHIEHAQSVISPTTRGKLRGKSGRKETDRQWNIARFRSAMREPYRSDEHDFDAQMNQFLLLGRVRERLSLGPDGRPIPAGKMIRPLQSGLLAQVAKALFIDANSNIVRLSKRIAELAGRAIVTITETDLKWNLMLEESPGRRLIQQCYHNMEDEPDKDLVLEPGTGWNGRCLEDLNGSNRRRPRVISAGKGEPLLIDLRDWTDDQKRSELRLTEATLERTRNIQFILSYPLRVPLGDGSDFYCPGFYNVHSTRAALHTYFIGAGPPHSAGGELPGAALLDLLKEIDVTLGRVRDTIESAYVLLIPTKTPRAQ